jgi:hypothetical protein
MMISCAHDYNKISFHNHPIDKVIEISLLIYFCNRRMMNIISDVIVMVYT